MTGVLESWDFWEMGTRMTQIGQKRADFFVMDLLQIGISFYSSLLLLKRFLASSIDLCSFAFSHSIGGNSVK